MDAVPMLVMLPLASGVPAVGWTWRPTNVRTHVFTVDAWLILTDTELLATTAPAAVVRSQPAPVMLSVPTAVLNLNPLGSTRAIVSPDARVPAVPSVIVGPVRVV